MQPYKLSEDCWLIENAAYLPLQKTIVISDLQLGEEQQLRALGHNIMYEQAERMLGLIDGQIGRYGAKRLVIDGDLKHDFGRISGQERRDILGMLRKLKKKVEIEVIRGNHDTITKPLTDRLGLSLHGFLEQDGFLFVHGHELPPESDAHTIIIGHMHPAISLSDGIRAERYKVFLIGTYRKKRVLVLPSFSTLSYGVDVLRIEPNTPLFSKRDVEKAEVYVIADEIRRFGTVNMLRRKMESF